MKKILSDNLQRKWLLLFMVVLMLSALLLSNWGIQAAAGQQYGTPVPPGQLDIDRLETLIADSQMDEQAQASLTEKLTMAHSIAADQAVSQGNPAIQAAGERPTPFPVIDAPIRTGIFDGHEGLFRANQTIIRNYWQGMVNNKIMQVFAGADGSDSAQSLVVVVQPSDDRTQLDFRFILAPVRAGALQVISETDGVLMLSAANGSRCYFNILEETFTPSEISDNPSP